MAHEPHKSDTTNPRGNTYYVLRHGEAEQNVRNIVYGKPDDNFALTPNGKDQVKAAAQTLSGITKIYASPVRRARESSEIAAEVLGIPKDAIVFDDRLREFDFGAYSGRSAIDFTTYRRDNIKTLGDRFPEGESYLDAKKRFGAWLYATDAILKQENVLIVSHGIGVESLECVVKGLSNAECLDYIRNHLYGYAHLVKLDFAALPVNGDFERTTA